jgi:hypothetical protein
MPPILFRPLIEQITPPKMNNNIKIRTALKFLLKKIFTFSILTKIFANYPKIAKLIKYLSNSLLIISTLNLILKYVFSIDLALLERLGIVFFLSQLLGKFSAYYRAIADYLKEKVDVTAPDLPKSVKTETPKLHTPDWDFEFFKKRKEFYEKLELIKTGLSEGKTISKEDVTNILNSGVTISEEDRTLLNNQLKSQKGWFSYFTDHPYITAAVIMSGAGIAIYLGSGGSAEDAKNAIVGVFSSFVSYITSHTKTSEVPLNNTDSKNESDIELKDSRTDQTKNDDGLESTRSQMSADLRVLVDNQKDRSVELLRLERRLNEPMSSEQATEISNRIKETVKVLKDYDSAKNEIIMKMQEMVEETSSKESVAFLDGTIKYLEVRWAKIDFSWYSSYYTKLPETPPIAPEAEDLEVWSNHADELRSNSSSSTRSNSPVNEESKDSTPVGSRPQTP